MRTPRRSSRWAISRRTLPDTTPPPVTVSRASARTRSASAALSNAEIYRESRELVVHLTTALDSRGVIDQAKRILMATQHCNADEAFEILRRASQRENRKLREIAARAGTQRHNDR